MGSPAWAEVEGLRVAYEAHGQGAALVFVHGWSGERTHWHRQPGAFTGHRLITLDLPGHGQSDKPVRDYPMGLFAGAVVAVLDAAEVERAVLIGHSNGVPIIREVARRSPDRVRGLVGVDGWLRNPLAPGMLDWMRKMAASPQYETMMRQMVERTPYGGLGPGDIELLKRSALATPAHVHRAGIDMMADPAVWAPDPIEVPLLLVHAASPQLAADYEDFVRGLAPHAEFEIWEGVSHFIPMERADDLNARISAFLAGLPEG